MKGVLGELDIFSFLNQFAKDDFHVEASEVITKAKMRASAKRLVSWFWATNIKSRRVLYKSWIAIRRAIKQPDLIALFE